MKKAILTLAAFGMLLFNASAFAGTQPNGYLAYTCGDHQIYSEKLIWEATAYDEELGEVYVVDKDGTTILQKTEEAFTTVFSLRKGFGLYEDRRLFRLDLRDSFGFGREGKSNVILNNLRTGEAIPCEG